MLCGSLLHGYSDSFLHTAVPHLWAVCRHVIRGPGHFCGCCESCGTAQLVRTSLLRRPHPCQSMVPSTHAHQPRAGHLLWRQASLPASGPIHPSLGFLLRHVHLDEGFPTLPWVGAPLGAPRAFSQPSQAGCTLRSVSKARAHRSARGRPGPLAGAEARGADTWIPAKQDPWCRHGPLRAPAPACVTLGQICKAPETYEVPMPPPGSG